MSKFTTQRYYYSTAVKLLHRSITDTPIIHNTLQPRSEKVLIWFGRNQQFELLHREIYRNRWKISYCHCQPIHSKFN